MNSTEKRDEVLLKIRPLIPSAKVSDKMSAAEKFQNSTLRPVIKLQHTMLLLAFRNYLQKHKVAYYSLNTENRKKYIEKIFSTDVNFRNQLGGMIIGQFTEQEYKDFHLQSDLRKRLINLIKQRILSQVHVL